ncbi:helix-turn-helix domain-containing protein [Leifsonia sp. TF02-11]|uniref:MarR family transcriptional regulator n=1 Tax=Leifsonia sp. TF02-11 TaxID=2815212 RepID=UPI001AA1C4C9|nr:helix-turn-helix domain-containing protein [Leifsonia sp. TF02-11]MBO1741347.1 hypothetical protein [Leifsonia sp. TF02-11]
MDTSDAMLALRGAGVRAVAEDASTLRTPDGDRIRVQHLRRTPTPSKVAFELANLRPGERALLIVPSITSSLRAAAEVDHRIIVAAGDELIMNGKYEPRADAATTPKPRRGPRPYGEFAVARALLAPQPERPVVQAELAARTGLKQPAVSDALKKLGDLVDRSRVGFEPADRAKLFDYAATEYPGAGGITTYWWHDSPIRAQGSMVVNATEDALVGGDLAASAINGWRQPEHALLYLHSGIDPTQFGFVAATREDYTLELVVPNDKTLWKTSEAFHVPDITDPVITYFDVRRTGFTGDQDEAAEKVRNTVVVAHQ